MSHMTAMKQIGARNMGYKIGIMEWSNKMDLIAISNDKGKCNTLFMCGLSKIID